MRTSYLSPPTRGVCVWRSNQGPGARDLSRRNAGTADPRWRISRPLRYPTFLRTEVRAPFARAVTMLNRYLPWGEGEPLSPRRTTQTRPLSTARCALFPAPEPEFEVRLFLSLP